MTIFFILDKNLPRNFTVLFLEKMDKLNCKVSPVKLKKKSPSMTPLREFLTVLRGFLPGLLVSLKKIIIQLFCWPFQLFGSMKKLRLNFHFIWGYPLLGVIFYFLGIFLIWSLNFLIIWSETSTWPGVLILVIKEIRHVERFVIVSFDCIMKIY